MALTAGQFFELGIDTGSAQSEYSWILTKDHRFVTAQRTRFFQTRQTEPGEYVLDVNVQDAAHTQTAYYSFILNIAPVQPNTTPVTPSGSGVTLIANARTQPMLQNGIVHLPAQGGILMIDPSISSGQITAFNLDANAAIDTDGNGIADDDRDNEGTFDQHAGTSLYLFLTPVQSPRTLALTAVGQDPGQRSTMHFSVVFDGAAQSSIPPGNGSFSSSQIILQDTAGVVQAQVSGLTINLSADSSRATAQTNQILLEWDFGDLTKSMLDHPSHTYELPGTYIVTLMIRSLQNGQVIYTGSVPVTVSGNAAVTSSIASSTGNTASSASSVPANTGTSNRFGGLLPYLQVGFIVLCILLLGIGAFAFLMWIKNKTGGPLQKTFEKMEGDLFDKKTDEPVTGTTTVMPLKKDALVTPTAVSASVSSDISDRELSHRDFSPVEQDNTAPTAQAGPVPSWLLNAETIKEQKAPESSPPPLTPESIIKTDDSVPSWLSAAPTPLVSPKSPDSPQSQPTPEEKIERPVEQDAPVPDWLKSAQTKTTPEPDTVKEPEAATLTELPPWLQQNNGVQNTPLSEPDPAVPASIDQLTPEIASAVIKTPPVNEVAAQPEPPVTVPASPETTIAQEPVKPPDEEPDEVETDEKESVPVASDAPQPLASVPASVTLQKNPQQLPKITSPSPAPAGGLTPSQKRRRRRKKKKKMMADGSQNQTAVPVPGNAKADSPDSPPQKASIVSAKTQNNVVTSGTTPPSDHQTKPVNDFEDAKPVSQPSVPVQHSTGTQSNENNGSPSSIEPEQSIPQESAQATSTASSDPVVHDIPLASPEEIASSATVSNAPASTSDDDKPIAIIRADSIEEQ